MADILDNYLMTVQSTGATSRDRGIFDRVQVFNDTFMNAPEYEQVRVTNDSSNTTNYDSWIYSNSSYKELVSMKTIIFAPGTPENIVFSGQYIRPQRQGGLFMLYSDDKQYEQKLKGLMDECTETLRWYDDDGNLRQYPVIVRKQSSGGLNEDKYMVLTDGTHRIGIPKDANTRALNEGREFIFSNKHKYRIAWIDDIKSSTYMEFKMEKYEENTELDNLELGIANYVNRPSFTLSTNISTSQISIGNTVQINHTLLDKDDLESDKPVVYSTSDASIATVSSSGLITGVANGSCTITVRMENNATVTDTISLTVTATPVDNIVYTIEPNIDTIYRSRNITFTAQKLNNGIVEAETYTFALNGGTANTSKFEFAVVDGDSFRIKNNGVSGTVIVRVTPQNDVGNAFDRTYTLSGAYS